MSFRCRICQRQFSTRSGLTRHANAVHYGRTTLSHANEANESRSQLLAANPKPEHDESLWNAPITVSTLTNNPTPDDDIKMEESSEDVQAQKVESITEDVLQHRYSLRSHIEVEVEENTEELETEIQLQINLKESDFDVDNLQKVSLDDALDTIEEKNRPERIANWPNDAYREFMELIIDNNISNKTGDKIIKFFNKHSKLATFPLPKSTRNGKDYLNQISSPSVDFKEKLLRLMLKLILDFIIGQFFVLFVLSYNDQK